MKVHKPGSGRCQLLSPTLFCDLIVPYLGVGIGADFIVASYSFCTFSLPLGVLVSLAKNVALDLGVRVKYRTGFDADIPEDLTMSAGYLGAQVVF